eukprot:UN04346
MRHYRHRCSIVCIHHIKGIQKRNKLVINILTSLFFSYLHFLLFFNVNLIVLISLESF